MNRFKLFLILFLPFILTGCKGDDIREFRSVGFSLSESPFKCEYVTEFKYLGENFAVGDNDSFYLLSYNLIFKNRNNCKQMENNLKIKSIFDEEVFKMSDNNLYVFNFDDYTFNPLRLEENKVAYLLLNDNQVLKVKSNENNYYVLKTDGNIYTYILDEKGEKIASVSLLVDKENYDGNIIDFDYDTTVGILFVKTKNTIYRNQIINEECLKYADEKCKYSVKKDNYLNKYKDNILGYNGRTLILKTKKVLTYQGVQKN